MSDQSEKTNHSVAPSRRAFLATVAVTGLLSAESFAASSQSPRQRLSLNDGWRFRLGDPDGLNGALDYDVRPEVKKSEDGKDADSRPTDAAKVNATRQVLKPWILPSANAFIRDPAKRHVRPDGHPGAEVSWVKRRFDDSKWDAVMLPHDWAIQGPFLETGPYGGMGRLKTWGAAWYRRTVDIPEADKGRSIFLDIDGAMSYATVWCNERLVGGWPYGYNSFRLDLTPHLQYGAANQIVIRLDNPPESARWYPGAGLYRNVWLVKTNAVHVAHWGTQITTSKVTGSHAKVAVQNTIDNDGTADLNVDVITRIYALDSKGALSGPVVADSGRHPLVVPARGMVRMNLALSISKPRLWGPPPHQRPNRYVAVTSVLRDGREVDCYETPFGIRTLRFEGKDGLLINDQPVRFQGVNNHHDLGAIGAAFNLRAAERQLEMLQEMGCNALRMSHNPPAPELLDLCDRMGILVIDEVFDSWEKRKTPLDFHLIFPDWHEADLRAMLRRDRNHPSIVMWSVGNEVGEQYSGKEGAEIGRRLVAIVREEDTSRPTTNGMNFAKPDTPLTAEFDTIGLNYQGEGIRQDPEFDGTDRIRAAPQYTKFHERFPDKFIYSSETAHAISSRGVYLFPVVSSNSSPTRDGRGGDPVAKQVSGYELYAVDYGSSADKVFAALDHNPYVGGEFVWTGFDYLGEPTPYYAARSSYGGIIDLAGFKKDRFWLYQSRWRPDLPVAHLLPHWNWSGREGEVTPVHLFTSGDEAELFVNGKSQGRIKKGPYEYRLRWDHVTYHPGEITAVVYKGGKEWARASRRTTGAAAALILEVDRAIIGADGKDLSFVTVKVVDGRGETVPLAKNKVSFHLEGEGDIIATDNGDATDFTPFPSRTRNAFNGLGLAIIRGRKDRHGKLILRATSPGLAQAESVIFTR